MTELHSVLMLKLIKVHDLFYHGGAMLDRALCVFSYHEILLTFHRSICVVLSV